jgi:hypothetical protein
LTKLVGKNKKYEANNSIISGVNGKEDFTDGLRIKCLIIKTCQVAGCYISKWLTLQKIWINYGKSCGIKAGRIN